jgi:hypothetical protein
MRIWPSAVRAEAGVGAAGVRRALAPALPARGWLVGTLVFGLAVYLAAKGLDTAFGVPHGSLLELLLIPIALAGIALAWNARQAGQADGAAGWPLELEGRANAVAVALLVAFVAVFVALNTVPFISAQDEAATIQGARQLVQEGNLRIESPLNEQYDTNIVGTAFAAYRAPDEAYYRTFAGAAILYTPFTLLPDDAGFYAWTVLFGAGAVIGVYLVALQLLQSRTGALGAAALFATSPVFAHWGTTVFTNIPVLGFELAALAIVLSSEPKAIAPAALAGALMGLAVFVRASEAVFILPLAALVLWRQRDGRALGAFVAPAVAGGALLLVANMAFYGDAFFLPHAATNYMTPEVVAPAEQTLGERTLDLVAGTDTDSSQPYVIEKLDNVLYHARYLLTSTFAFPFLAAGLAGVAWRLAAGRRESWVLVAAIAATAGAVLLAYGHQADNYFGYGDPVVRSSFIRYALPVYALLAVAGAAFFLEAGRALLRSADRRMLAVAGSALVAVLAIGVFQSYDREVYGLNRLNDSREQDQTASASINSYLKARTLPVIVGGASGSKLLDQETHTQFVNYSPLPAILRGALLWPVLEKGIGAGEAYAVLSDFSLDDRLFRQEIYVRYRAEQLVKSAGYRLLRLYPEAALFELDGATVWETFSAPDRWTVTRSGYLQTTNEFSYFESADLLDVDGNGTVDKDVIIQIEYWDFGETFTLHGLDSGAGRTPVLLAEVTPSGNGDWLALEVPIHVGDQLRKEFYLSSDVSIRALRVLSAAGGD